MLDICIAKLHLATMSAKYCIKYDKYETSQEAYQSILYKQ